MQSIDLAVLLQDPSAANELWAQLGVSDATKAHQSLVSIAKNGVPFDLLHDIVDSLRQQLSQLVNPDAGLRNLDRFISSARSPISLAALLVRDPAALSSLLNIFTSSEFLSDLLIQDPESFDLLRLTDGQPVARQTLIEELKSEIGFISSTRGLKNGLRRFKKREVLRIAYGEYVRKFETERTAQQLTVLAEAVCEVAFHYCYTHLVSKYGEPVSSNGQNCKITFIAKDSLGSGDIDYSRPLILTAVYSGEGTTEGKHKVSAADFFERLMDEFKDVLTETNEHGDCYEVRFDCPTSSSHQQSCSSYHEATRYLDQTATAADRLENINCRFLCGDAELGERFLTFVQTLVFRNFLNVTDVVEVQSLRSRIKTHPKPGSSLRNIQNDVGAIEEVEFTVRFLQLLVGKKIESVRHGNVFQVLFELEKNGIITLQEMSVLRDNYSFLRKVSHRLQLLQNSPTNILPKNAQAIGTLTKLVTDSTEGDPSFDLLDRLSRITSENRTILSHLLPHSNKESVNGPAEWILDPRTQPESFKEHLTQLGFSNPTIAQSNIEDLANEKHRFIPNNRCRYFLSSIITKLLQEISSSPDPDATLTQLAQVSDSLGGKATLWELFQVNHSCLKLYVDICAQAPYLASILKTNPGMLDELMDSLMLDGCDTSQFYKQELATACASSKDVQPIVLAFKNSKHLQIGVSQLVQEKSSAEIQQALRTVADCCFEKIASHEFDRLVEKHGYPMAEDSRETSQFDLLLCGRHGTYPAYHCKVSFWIVYSGEGQTESSLKQTSISNQHFFNLLVTRIAKSISHNGLGGRIYELENIPAFLGDAVTIALSVKQLDKLLERKSENASLAVFLTTCRTLPFRTDSQSDSSSLLKGFAERFDLSRNAWSQFWELNQKLTAAGGFISDRNLLVGPGGFDKVDLIARALHFKYFSQRSSSSIVQIIQSLENARKINVEDSRLLIDAVDLIQRVQLSLGLMNLPKTTELPSVCGDRDSANDELEPSDPDDLQRLQIQQRTLAKLMRYDRFDSLADDVQSCLHDNRRLIARLYEQLLDEK